MALGDDFAEILAAAGTGAEWAFARIYRDLQPGVHRYLAAQAGPAVADDLAQDTWLSAARGLARFEGDEPRFRAWLFTIARHRLIEHWRREGRRPRTVAVDPADLREAPALGAWAADPAGRATAAAAELVAGLPADQAEVVLLRVVGGFSAEEVGQIIGKRAGAVRVIQHRALRTLANRGSAV